MGDRFAHVSGQTSSGKGGTDTISFGLLAQLLGGKEEFSFRVTLQCHIGGATGDPAALDLGIGRADIKGIVAHRDSRFDNFRIPKLVVPVVKVIHFDPTALLDESRLFCRGGAGIFQKAVGISHPSMFSFSPLPHPPQIGGLGRHPKTAVLVLVIDLIGIVDTVEFPSTIHDNRLRESFKPLDANAEYHHDRAIRGRIKGQVDGEQAPGVGIHHERGPGLSQQLAGRGAEHFNIELGMIDMGNLEGTTAMPGRTVLQFGVTTFLPERRFNGAQVKML